jgi:TonB family protein
VLDRAGRVVSASIAQSSGDASFDNAALAMMRRADPVPPPPALIADDGLSFSLPVISVRRAASDRRHVCRRENP